MQKVKERHEMKKLRIQSLLVATLLIGAICAQAADRPNVLLVMADDLGFSDLGCYGGEIETPVLDALAAGGSRFTQFYNTARCWPTRAALLTGYYAQQVRRDDVPGVPSGGGNRGVRPDWAPLLPAILGPAGYRTYHSGKWHIDSTPLKTGFDRSYTLWRQGNFFRPSRHELDGTNLPQPTTEDNYYGTIAIADHAVDFLKNHQQDHGLQPFFAYVAFTAPHFPLHALPEDIAKYTGRYDVGWENIRQARYRKQAELGFPQAALSQVETEQGPPYDFPDAFEILGPGEVKYPVAWDSLTAEQKKFQSAKMAIHAAMIDRMDRELGRIVDQIKAMGQFDNTLVLFLSDNGASAEIMVRDDGHDPSLPLGGDLTYPCLGPGWSTACNTPFRKHKTWVHEGGCATPLIVSWPAGITDGGSFRSAPSHVIDIVPTILALANTELPEHSGPASPGHDLTKVLTANTQPEQRSIWWMHDGHRAFRDGDWKAVSTKDGNWELYNLAADRNETNNLAATDPDRLASLTEKWQSQWEQIQSDARP